MIFTIPEDRELMASSTVGLCRSILDELMGEKLSI